MSRFYAVPFAGTVTNAGGDNDLFELAPASNKPVRLCGFTLGQTSEVADAAEEGVRISVIRMTATVTGSNGTSTTPVPMDGVDTAAGAACEVNGTTVATTSGTATTVCEMAWNIRNSPYEFWFPPEFRPYAKNAEFIFVRMQTTLADDISFAGTFFFEETG